MRLRKLEIKDAPLMLEWMHDENVTEFMGADFASKKIEDCETFISASEADDKNVHFAIADENDEYMGTVSLKHVDNTYKTAEFAISTRRASMGKGYAAKAMKEILEYGINTLKLDKIYWCVSTDNKRAVRFYDKNLYKRTEKIPEHILKYYAPEQLKKFIWYCFE